MNKLIILFIVLMPLSSLATIQINTTRVIFDESENEQTFEVNNLGKKTALVHVWLSENESNDKIADSKFIITQPVFKIRPEKSKVVRIIGTSELKDSYPKDRETMLWLNFLDIPPENSQSENSLNIAIHTKIKFFYLPSNININRQDAGDKLTWRMENSGNDSYLVATNKSPIYVNLGSVLIDDNAVNMDSSFISPFSETRFKLKNKTNGKNINIKYSYIDDLGAYISKEVIVSWYENKKIYITSFVYFFC
nr:molecular chaperone [Providencia rettgeri]